MSKKKDIILKYSGEKPQYLGMDLNNKPIVIEKEKHLTEKEWDKIKDGPWNKKLIEKELLVVNNTKNENNIDEMEKDIEEGMVIIADD